MFLYLACVRLVFFAVVTGPCDLEAAYVYMAAICLIYWQLLPYYLARVQLAFFAVITGLCPYEANFAYVATFKLVYRHFWLRSSSVASVLAISMQFVNCF